MAQPNEVNWDAAQAVVVHGGEQIELEATKLGKTWIQSENLMSRTDLDFSYANSPSVWFKSPPVRKGSDGLIRTVDGEQFVLSDGGFEIASWSEAKVVVRFGNQETAFPLQRIRSIKFPTAL